MSVFIQYWPSNDQALSCAESAVPADHIGPCAVELDGKITLVLPNYAEAATAARLAVDLQVGGYSSAVIVQAKPGQQITHRTGHEWAFS